MKNGTIQKTPNLKPSEDYLFLRQKGLEYIEQMGHAVWTDYNIHDPGVTLIENLGFALTELGYRTGFPTTDLLAEVLSRGGLDQAFFTAAEIFTTLPITLHDYRRFLMDQPGIRQAWLLPRECACEMPLYPDCARSELRYTANNEEPVSPKGTYDVLLEFEEDPLLGSLNDGRLLTNLFFGNPLRQAEIEIRFPVWSYVENHRHLPPYEELLRGSTIANVKVELLNAANLVITSDSELRKALRNTPNARWKITLTGGLIVEFKASVAVFMRKGSDAEVLTLSDLQQFLTDPLGPAGSYQRKLMAIQKAIRSVEALLDRHRNLSEAFCRYQEVGIEDVAVCADVILSQDADIEKVQAQIYFEIETYFNPPVRFYSLRDMLDRGVPVEEIFNGPCLRYGFLLDEELEASELRRDVRTSDILNRIMEIEGVLAVQNFVMTRYDQQGRAQLPSQPWRLEITPRHRARLYPQRSKLLFFKNELPFLPANPDEVTALLQQLKSTTNSYKLTIHENDLPVPTGRVRDMADYYPVQFQLPLNYGVSFEGLPREATDLRRAQAKQLKAYLLPFEQTLANGFSQLSNVSKLFSLDETVDRTMYGQVISKDLLATSHIDPDPTYELYVNPAFGQTELDQLLETQEQFLTRRNRLLDHLLARFGESFADYALLTSTLAEDSNNVYTARKMELRELIADKIHFLKDYPVASQQRAKAFNYRDELHPTGLQNIPGIKRRLAHLLGLEALRDYFTIDFQPVDKAWIATILFRDETQRVRLKNETEIKHTTRHETTVAAYQWIDTVIAFVTDPGKYDVVQTGTDWFYVLKDSTGTVVAHSQPQPDQPTTEGERDALFAWAQGVASFERFFVVEHLLLRPRVYGALTLPVCLTPDCDTCTDYDPYSFRLTFVMPGWTPRFRNLNFRRYAERLIRTETPSHLLVKICWIGNAIYEGEGENGLYCQLLKILEDNAVSLGSTDEEKTTICAQLRECTQQIIDLYNEAYGEAVYNNDFASLTATAKKKLFEDRVQPELVCSANLTPAGFTALQDFLSEYYKEDNCALGAADSESVKDAKALCFQMNAFHQAWNEWLLAEKDLNRETPSLEKHLEQLLVENLKQAVSCEEIEKLLAEFGDRLRAHLENQFLINASLPTDASWQNSVKGHIEAAVNLLKATLPELNNAAVATELVTLVVAWYLPLKAYLYAHTRLIGVFRKLKSIYPPATLHDCADGDDGNVVRLDGTVIG